jgi:hypothetical protein
MFRPWDVTGVTKKRFGPQAGDGGYVILDSPFSARHLLGYGVDKDVTFENQVTEAWGISAHVFDHTITDTPHMGPRVSYVNEGIGPKDEAPLFSLATHVARYVPDGEDFILKMDVEGAEWDVLATADLSRVTQLILEIHDLQNDHSDIIRKINEKFFLVHVHGNNHHNQPWIFIDRVHRMPRYLECSWVRKDLVHGATPSVESFPGPLDIKCRPDAEELQLNFWDDDVPPVSFVTDDPAHIEPLRAIMTQSDEIVSAPEKARHDRLFLLRKGDVFPYEIIRFIHRFQFSVSIPVIYNGALVNPEMRFVVIGSSNAGEIKVPIHNLKPLGVWNS